MIDEHATAVLTLLNATVTAPHKVFDGRVDNNTDPATGYVVVYFAASDPEFDFEAKAWRFQLTATCHSVSTNAQGARQMGDLTRSALLAVVPTVANRTCWPIMHEPGVTEPVRDETTGVTVMDQIDRYVLESLPG